jgi:hypothetical protein
MSSGPTRQRKVLDSKKAWLCATINQLAFPGMGTVMAGRWTGYLQAVVMLIGFGLTMMYMLAVIHGAVELAMSGAMTEESFRASYHQNSWALKWGLLLSALAWIWSLVSSILIVRGVPKEPPVLGSSP